MNAGPGSGGGTTGERLYETPAGIVLGPVDLIAPGSARSFVVQMRSGRFHGFIVRRGQDLHGYVDRCPHMGLPLAQILDGYLAPGGELVACSWHAALFEIDTGLCVGGPCAGTRLMPWPVRARDGLIVTEVAE